MAWREYEHEGSDAESGLQDLEKRRRLGETFELLSAPAGSKKLVTTFWGRSWCRHLEGYSDYEFRLPRGRSYLRNGRVYNLSIDSGAVSASVVGSSLYEVLVRVAPLDAESWQRIQTECAGGVGSLLDLLAGRLGPGVMEVICNRDTGIFPAPREIRMSCTCPDWADMCKHVAAVMYGVGVRFDSDPALFFKLRGVDPLDLFRNSAQAVQPDSASSDHEILGEDLGALFGIDLVGESPGVPGDTAHGAEIVDGEGPKAPQRPSRKKRGSTDA